MTVLALDLGGTNLRAGLACGPVAPDALPRPVLQLPAPAGLAAFRRAVDDLIARHRPAAIGVAIPGLARGTVCDWVPNLPWLDGVDLAALFPAQPVRLANDAHMALGAEAAAGAAEGQRAAILLAIGTGIGSAVLAHGRVMRGGATSFGWACADLSAPGASVHGWLESVAAGPALDRAAQSIGLADGPALIVAARAGKPAAAAALRPACIALGTALAGAVALTGVAMVIVAGGVAGAMDVMGPVIRARLTAHLPPHLRNVILVPAAFGSGASLAGAALAASGHPVFEETPA